MILCRASSLRRSTIVWGAVVTLGDAEIVVVVGDTVEENCPGDSDDDEEAAELMRALLTG